MAITVTEALSDRELPIGLSRVSDAVSLKGGGAVVLGTKEGNPSAILQIYGADGRLVSVIDTGIGGFPSAIVQNDDNSFSVFVRNGGFAATIIQTFTNAGKPEGEPYIAYNASFKKGVTMKDGGFVGIDMALGFRAFFVERFGDGFAEGETVMIDTTAPTEYSSTVLSNGNIVFAWSKTGESGSAIHMAILRPDGTFAMQPRVFDDTGSVNRLPALATTANGFALAYSDNESGSALVKVAYLTASGALQGTKSAGLSPNSTEITMTEVGGRLVIAHSFPAGDTDAAVRVLPGEYIPGPATTYGATLTGFSPAGDSLSVSRIVKLSDTSFIALANDINTQTAVGEVMTIGLRVDGGAENDSYAATGLAETISLGAGFDTVSYSASKQGIAVSLFANTAGKGGMANGDLLFGVDKVIGSNFDDSLRGGAGNDHLVGRQGVDTIRGGLGSDTIEGGGGADVLWGGGGADRFVFLAAADIGKGSKRDVIHDFQFTDRIDLAGIDANTKVAGDQAFGFNGTRSGANKLWLSVDQQTGTVVRGDVNGDGTADFQLFVKGVIGLSATEFFL